MTGTAGGTETWQQAYRRHGYFFRWAAGLTIATGFYLHLSRIFLGDDILLAHILTRTFDRLLTIPMIYAAVTGILVYPRIIFANRPHRVAVTASLAYMTLSVPLHLWGSYLTDSVSVYTRTFPVWFSFLLLVVYTVFMTLFVRLRIAPERITPKGKARQVA